MKKEHKKFLKIIKKTLRARPDLSLQDIIFFLLKNIPEVEDSFVLLTMKRKAKNLIANVKDKKENNSAEGSSTGGVGGSQSTEE